MVQKSVKKISLLTFHRALSYGAVLQTYALIKELKSMGHDVEIIDFQLPFLPKTPTGLWSLKKYFGFEKLKKEWVFYTFRQKYFKSKTKKFLSLNAIKKSNFDSDIYIVGSDQVWNPRITKSSLYIYFFNFLKGVKLSYAASFGTDSWDLNENETNKIKNYLKDFRALSVRENSGQEIIENVFGLNAKTVLDPTLVWADYSNMIKPIKYKNYIFCFKVNYDILFINKAIEIGLKLNKEVVFVGDNLKYPNSTSINNPSVEEWISLLYNSDFVFTDSFHGLCFSLNFKKNFIMYNANKERFTRIDSLLKMLNIEDRIYKSTINFTENLNPINYEKVDELLNSLKINSQKFLTKQIG
jgi:hypothetical protein